VFRRYSESPGTLLDFVFIITKDFSGSNWMKYPAHEYKNFSDSQTQFS